MISGHQVRSAPLVHRRQPMHFGRWPVWCEEIAKDSPQGVPRHLEHGNQGEALPAGSGRVAPVVPGCEASLQQPQPAFCMLIKGRVINAKCDDADEACRLTSTYGKCYFMQAAWPLCVSNVLIVSINTFFLILLSVEPSKTGLCGDKSESIL